MKNRIEGYVRGDQYVVCAADGGVIKETPLADARTDTKLAAAIKRNGWQAIPEA